MAGCSGERPGVALARWRVAGDGGAHHDPPLAVGERAASMGDASVVPHDWIAGRPAVRDHTRRPARPLAELREELAAGIGILADDPAGVAARRSANSVSPPVVAASLHDSSENVAGMGLNELSVCHAMFDSNMRATELPARTMSPLPRTLDRREKRVSLRELSARSRGPKRRAKARCASSERCCPGNTTTA